jgi:hypothetical protein
VEGIESSSEHSVSDDSIAITRNKLDAGTPLKPSESELQDPTGTRVRNLHFIDNLLQDVRRVWGALRVV